MKKFILVLMSIMLTAGITYAGTFKADAKTKRIPAGTTFELEFIQPINTFSSTEGDYFAALLKNELKAGNTVILPMGSVVRGSISTVKTAKRFSRGGKLYLDFDHVVTPNGRQIPLDMAVCKYDKIYYDGGLYKNLGYGEALQNNYEKAKEITINATEYGLRAGESYNGLQYITTPMCAIGGFLGSVGYYIGDGIADMFRKGQDVYINKGESMMVKLINPIDIPVY